MKACDIKFIIDPDGMVVEFPVIDFGGRQCTGSVAVIKTQGDSAYLSCSHKIINILFDIEDRDDVEYVHKLIVNNTELDSSYLESMLLKFNMINAFIDEYLRK